MKNTILKYDKEDITIDLGFSDNFSVSDFFSKNTVISDLLIANISLMEIYQMQTDDKLERVSQELYGSPDYWDLLCLLNDRNPLFGVAYNFTNISDFAAAKLELYENVIYSHSPLLQQRSDELLNEILSNADKDNEKLRFIYVVKPSRLNEFISILKANKFI